MDRPKVSVVMPTWNRADLIADSLDSVLNQTLPPSQVIVVNDGSTDRTREVLERYKSRIEYLEQPNGGRARALNLGFSRVTGDYIWTFDDDDIAFPDFLERSLKVFEAHPELGFTYSSHIRVKSRPGEKAFKVIGPQSIADDIPEEDLLISLMLNAFMNNQGMVVRTSCYRQVGPFDPELLRCQDYDVAMRLVRAFRCARVRGPTFYFRVHNGIRGSAKDPISPKMFRQKVQRFYDRIFLPLRKELSLRDYLPRSWNGQQTEYLDERRAYLQRMSVMASKGLMEEMLEDLSLALGDGSDGRPLSEAEWGILWATMSTPTRDDTLFAGPEYVRRIRKLCQGKVGREIHYELARGLYWRFLGALRAHDFSFAFRLTRCAWWFVGIRPSVDFILEKLKRGPGPRYAG
jgi:glycosyltransferase involved in cell wall biosynthesis